MIPKKKKAPPPPLPPPKDYDGCPVFVDVYSWILEIKKQGKLPITGPFRLAYALVSQQYWPAIILAQDDQVLVEEITALSQVLGKNIAIFQKDLFAQAHPMKAWISIAVDHYCPYLPELPPHVKKVAILHDILSQKGVFGHANYLMFQAGIEQADALLCVSNTTKRAYYGSSLTSDRGMRLPIIPFPNCHRFDAFAEDAIGLPRTIHAVSLHSLFKRKNIERTMELSGYYLRSHTHVGALGDIDVKQWAENVNTEKVHWHPYAIDPEIDQLLVQIDMFICSSLAEGFCMPPMEAMLNGVPYILLSDIPIHREIYGDFNVNFVSPTLGDLTFPLRPKSITEEDRKRLFFRNTYDNMVKGLNDYLQSI